MTTAHDADRLRRRFFCERHGRNYFVRPGCGSRRDTEALRAILLDAAGTRELPDDTKAGPVSAASIVAIEIHIIIVPVPPSHADPSLRLTPGPRVHAKSRTGILPPTAARRINVEFTNLWILRRTVARKDSAAPPAEKRFVGGSVITTWATWIPMATRQEDLPDIADHIVKTDIIWEKAPDFRGANSFDVVPKSGFNYASPSPCVSADAWDLVVVRIDIQHCRRRSGALGVLPLGTAGKTVRPLAKIN